MSPADRWWAGWYLTRVFCLLDGRDIERDADRAFELVMEVANGLGDLEQIAQRLGLSSI